jgi:hypothetical protein
VEGAVATNDEAQLCAEIREYLLSPYGTYWQLSPDAKTEYLASNDFTFPVYKKPVVDDGYLFPEEVRNGR